jgi:hypothetical protein
MASRGDDHAGIGSARTIGTGQHVVASHRGGQRICVVQRRHDGLAPCNSALSDRALRAMAVTWWLRCNARVAMWRPMLTVVVTEITSAAGHQADGIGQVNAAVSELDQMTQQNSALVEQSAAAAESLREQTKNLTASMGALKLPERV